MTQRQLTRNSVLHSQTREFSRPCLLYHLFWPRSNLGILSFVRAGQTTCRHRLSLPGRTPRRITASIETNLQSQGQYYLIILRTQHLLTGGSLTLSIRELWSLWLLRAECLRALLAPRLAALELNRIKIPEGARIPWDFQVMKILLVGMASGRWASAINELGQDVCRDKSWVAARGGPG